MAIFDAIIAPVAKLLDKLIPDPEARDRAKLELLKLQGSQEMEQLRTQLSAIVAEAQSADPSGRLLHHSCRRLRAGKRTRSTFAPRA